MKIRSAIIVLILFAAAQMASAGTVVTSDGLVLSINTADETLTFLESDTVFGENNGYAWGGFLGESGNFNLSLAESGLPNALLTINVVDESLRIDGFFDNFTPNEPFFLIGSGTPISYSALPDAEQAFLEGFIGSTVAPDIFPEDTGLSPLRVISAVTVPEPASAAALGVIGIVGLCVRRRRRV